MHIEFGLGFQKLGANSRRKFLAPEIDLLLNRAQDQFVLDQLLVQHDERGFRQLQLDLDKVRPLVVRNREVKTYFKDGNYAADLPGDYMFLINDTWNTDCASPDSAATNRYYYAMPLPDPTNKYKVVRLSQSGTLVDLQTEYANYDGFNSAADKFQVIPLLLEAFHQKKRNGIHPNLDLYWEKAPGYYRPDHLILVANLNLDVAITVDDTTTTHTPQKIEARVNSILSGTTRWVPSRVIKTEEVPTVLNTPFYGPQKESPISTLEGLRMHVYPHKSRIVNGGLITYLRRPDRISLGLQRSCELDPLFHQSIIDLAVQFAAGSTEQQLLYQIKAQENAQNK